MKLVEYYYYRIPRLLATRLNDRVAISNVTIHRKARADAVLTRDHRLMAAAAIVVDRINPPHLPRNRRPDRVGREWAPVSATQLHVWQYVHILWGRVRRGGGGRASAWPWSSLLLPARHQLRAWRDTVLSTSSAGERVGIEYLILWV